MFVSILCEASDTGILAGSVRDPAGATVQGEAVLLVCHGSGQSERHLSTDGKGQFSIELAAGSCDVFFSHNLFDPVAKSVQIKSGKKSTLNLQLRFRKGLKFVE